MDGVKALHDEVLVVVTCYYMYIYRMTNDNQCLLF